MWIAVGLCGSADVAAAKPVLSSEPAGVAHGFPYFESNLGQAGEAARFLGRFPAYTVLLTSPDALVILGGHPGQGPSSVVRMRLLGADSEAAAEGLGKLRGRSHYLLSNDPAGWHRDVSHFSSVRYSAVYPGIDLLYYTRDGELEADFVVAPGVDPSLIRVSFDGTLGIWIEDEDLILETRAGKLRQKSPVIYQTVDGHERRIPGGYTLDEDLGVGFEIGAYDPALPLVIDPVLSYSTLLGGSGTEEIDVGRKIAVDGSGHVYVTGRTLSFDFPTLNPFQGSIAGNFDIFVTKLDPSGSSVIYSTYLGGSGRDEAYAIVVDAGGNAYVAGRAIFSFDFPITAGAFQTGYGGGFRDCVVTKLNPAGNTLLYSTFLGGSSCDSCTGMAVDAAGNAYVTGFTASSNFPTAAPLQPAHAGSFDGFVSKLDPTGSTLVYSTYFGGSGSDDGIDITVDGAGNVYLTGDTASTNLPLASPLQGTFGGVRDAFFAKFNAAGSALVYASYLGGSGFDQGWGIAIDPAGNVHVAGVTGSTDFPTQSPLQASNGGADDSFITKINASGSALVYSTYFGGSGSDDVNGLALDTAGNAYVTGHTNSSDLPVLNSLQTFGGLTDAFLVKLRPSGTQLAYSTYFGGSGTDRGRSVAVDGMGGAYILGETDSSLDFPTTGGAFQTAYGGGSQDAFVAKILDQLTVDVDVKPGSFPNSVNPGSKGMIPVALLSTSGFDATNADQATLRFGPGAAGIAHSSAHPKDVDDDGDIDLVLHFRTRETGIACGDETVRLTGETASGQQFEGEDAITTTGCT